MCGITGLFSSKDSFSKDVLISLNERQNHRGPDDSGVYWHTSNGGLAHTRLSIIDLKEGNQPMSLSSRYVITYNGELYNYKELRKELRDKNCEFQTSSDTEVILNAYAVWGEDCLKKLRGMFAFAILDKIKNTVFLARDHIGIKPLHYLFSDGDFAFCSELQALSVIPNFEFDLNLSAIDDYLWMQYIPAPATIFKNVYKLQPGHYLKYQLDGTIGKQIKFWDLEIKEDKKKSEDDFLEELKTTLKNSVKAHMQSDVPFGAFLSGGIDSTLIVKYMQELSSSPIKTFSIGFKDEYVNELKYSRKVADQYQTDHTEYIVEESALSVLPKLVAAFGEPFADSSSIPTYFVSLIASKERKMVLSGDGADEIFAGYNTYGNWLKAQRFKYMSLFKQRLEPFIGDLFPAKFYGAIEFEDYFQNMTLLDENAKTNLWQEHFLNEITSSKSKFEKLFYSYQLKGKPNIKAAQYLDIKTYLPGDILAKVDICSMLNSLEVRTPFIDTEVLKLAMKIPDRFNISNSKTAIVGKRLLKRILEDDFDKEFIYRRKQGFGIPIESWFGETGGLESYVKDDIIENKNSILSNFLNMDTISLAIIQKKYSFLWAVIVLELWLRNFNLKANSIKL